MIRAPVLVADDDPVVRSLIESVLAPRYDITAVPDGTAAARALLSPVGFAAAVLDGDMPGLSGPEVVSQVRAAGCRTPVLLVSGSVDPRAVPHLAGDPFVAFLPKPFQVGALSEAVASLVSGSSGSGS